MKRLIKSIIGEVEITQEQALLLDQDLVSFTRSGKIVRSGICLPLYYSWIKKMETVKLYLGKGFLIPTLGFYHDLIDDGSKKKRYKDVSIIGSYSKSCKGFITFTEDGDKENDTRGVHRLSISFMNNKSCFYTKQAMINGELSEGAIECWTNDIGGGNYMLCSIRNY